MTDTTTEAVDKVADLIERLEYGVCPSGIHEDNQTELFLVDDANDTMAEAAATIRTLATRIEQLERYLRLEQSNNVKFSWEIERINSELAAEKALAEDIFEAWRVGVEFNPNITLAAHRKARGL